MLWARSLRGTRMKIKSDVNAYSSGKPRRHSYSGHVVGRLLCTQRRLFLFIFLFLHLGDPSRAFQTPINRISPSPSSISFADPIETRLNRTRPTAVLPEPEVATPRKQTSPLKASRGIFLAFCIILGLAVNGSETPIVASDAAAIDGLAKTAVSNVIDASLPTNPTDLLAVALGESIGGILGGVGTVIVSAFLKLNKKATKFVQKPQFTQALSDTDYFIANSASLPLLQAAGLSPAVASIGSVIVAAIPSQLVKISAQRKKRLLEEENLMEELLREQNSKQREKSFANRSSLNGANKDNAVDPMNLIPVVQDEIDTVEVFCDVTRWLEYNTLQADFGKIIAWDGNLLPPAASGAFFGIVAFVSSQLYADFLYGTFQFGPKNRQDEVATRTSIDWLALYFSKALYAATLFGCYELFQRPISRLIQGTLAGGVDGCIGSESFDVCLQTYIDTNSPGPSPEAQLRALVTNLVMVGQRVQDIAVDTSAEDVKALVGAWSVSAYSYLHEVTPIF